MSIVCGIDFSSSSLRAARAAAALAERMRLSLHLVRAIEPDAIDFDPERVARTKRHLEDTAARVKRPELHIETHLEQAPPDEALEAVAERVGAQLIVVAALGHRREGKWRIGSHAERLAQHSKVPVLIVRKTEAFEDWCNDVRALRILLGVDLSQSADGALEWIAALGKFGRCDVIEAHLYWPPQQFERLGLAGLHSYIDPDPAVTETLCAAFVKRSQRILKVPPLKLHVEPHLGRVADRLATIADEEHADLIVVGSHARGLRGRMLHGSVSHDILHSARVSVVTVPPKAATKSSSERTAKNVLVATDFSPVANTAIPLAYGIVADGGTVHLVHVIEDDAKSLEPRDIFSASTTAASERETAARQRLIDLIPEPHGRAVASTETHVLCSNHPARAVCQAAERLDADVICLGTHHHVGVAKLLLGSVASAVLSATERPVLFTRLPRE